MHSEDKTPLLASNSMKSGYTELEGVEGESRLAPSAKRGAKISTWMLVGLIYYTVSGGPLGMEVAVRAGGPLLALLGFVFTPFIWSLPEAAMTAELSVAFPEVLTARCTLLS